MGDVIQINYPATRKYVVLERREKRMGYRDYTDTQLDAILQDMHDDLFTKALEEDELRFTEINRKKTQCLDGELVSLWRYRSIREFIKWFRKERILKCHKGDIQLPLALGCKILEAHDIAKLLHQVNENRDSEYLSLVDRAAKKFLRELENAEAGSEKFQHS